MIDMVALQSLIAVEETGSVVGAAASLGFTPSAVSQQVKRLERRLDVALLERVGRGVVLTHAARTLVKEGRSALATLDVAAARLGSDGPLLSGQLRLAAFSTAVRGLVAPVLRDLASTTPQIAVTLTESDPAEALDLVGSGRVDLAVVHNWDGVALHGPESLRMRTIGSDRADVLLHRRHRLAGCTELRPGDLLDEEWVSTGVGTICHAWFLHMYAGHARAPHIAFWAWEFASHVRLVEEDLAVALVPRLGRGPLPADVVAVPVLDPVPSRNVQVAWRASNAGNPLVDHVVGMLAQRAGRTT